LFKIQDVEIEIVEFDSFLAYIYYYKKLIQELFISVYIHERFYKNLKFLFHIKYVYVCNFIKWFI